MAAIDLVRYVCTAETSSSGPLPGGLSVSETTLLLARCAVGATLPLHGRLRAVALLAQRSGGGLLLRRLLRAPDAVDAVRALAAQRLGVRADQAALPELLAAARDPAFPLARRAAAHALGICGRASADVALLVLLALLDCLDDLELAEAAAAGLGALGDTAAIPALAALLGSAALPRLRHCWTEHTPLVAQLPPAEWPLDELPAPAKLLVSTLLIAGETDADRPGSLNEFLLLLASRLSRAAAAALAQIGGGAAREALYVALLSGPHHDDAPALLECLGHLDEDAPLTLLGEPDLDPMLRWLVARRCAECADPGALEQALAATHSDPFARGAFVLALRNAGDHAATIVYRLAAGPNEDAYVREQALATLSPADTTAVAALLLPLLQSASTPISVRCAAAAALPAGLSDETRLKIYELLRERQLPGVLCAALLATLGIARDRAALPLLLRHCQSSVAEVARAAVDALAILADAVALPVLVGLSQSPTIDRALRLHAAGALLLIGGEEFLPLLRPALDHGSIALQFQALGYIMRALPSSPLLYELLQNHEAALPLRRLVAHALPGDLLCARLLCALLHDEQAPLALRVVAADRLGARGWPEVLTDDIYTALAELAGLPQAQPALCWRCIAGLGRANTPATQRFIGRIAVDASLPDERRVWAAHALLAQWTIDDRR